MELQAIHNFNVLCFKQLFIILIKPIERTIVSFEFLYENIYNSAYFIEYICIINCFKVNVYFI